MRFVLVFLLALACTHKGSTDRKASVRLVNSESVHLYLGACTADGHCDEVFKHKIADYFCRERGFYESVAFKTRMTGLGNEKSVKINSCNLKESHDSERYRCVWSEEMLREDQREAEIFSEIICRKIDKEDQTYAF